MAQHCLVTRLIKHVILPVTEAALPMLYALHQGPTLISLPLGCRHRNTWADQYCITSPTSVNPAVANELSFLCCQPRTQREGTGKREERSHPIRRRSESQEHKKQLKTLALALDRPRDRAQPAFGCFRGAMLFSSASVSFYKTDTNMGLDTD